MLYSNSITYTNKYVHGLAEINGFWCDINYSSLMLCEYVQTSITPVQWWFFIYLFLFFYFILFNQEK